MKRTRLLFLLCIALPTLSFAELKDENLLQSIPQGYKIDYQTQQGNVLLTEMVPKAETVNNWTEMVTTHVYLGAKKTFRMSLFKPRWKKAGWLHVRAVKLHLSKRAMKTAMLFQCGCKLAQTTPPRASQRIRF